MKIPASTKREKQMKIKISSTYMQQIQQWNQKFQPLPWSEATGTFIKYLYIHNLKNEGGLTHKAKQKKRDQNC